MKRLIFVVIYVMMLFGCGAVTDKGIKSAYVACQPHGGVSYIQPLHVTASNSCEVMCRNGMFITLDGLN